MKSKKIDFFWWGVLLFFIIVLVFPIRMAYLDGGTTTYSAILYKIIHWNGFPVEKMDGRSFGFRIIFIH